MISRRRISDSEGEQSYKRRVPFDLKTITVLIVAMFGSGGVTGLVSLYTDPNVKLQTKIDTVSAQSETNKDTLTTIDSEVKQNREVFENYVKHEAEMESLRQQLIDSNHNHLKELLEEIRKDVKSIKNGD